MSNRSEEFARISKAEQQLCDEAGPVFVAIIRAIDAHAGLRITEVRVTLDPADWSNGSIVANCTIVRAHAAAPSAGDDIRRAIDSTGAPTGRLSSNRKQCLK